MNRLFSGTGDYDEELMVIRAEAEGTGDHNNSSTILLKY